MTKQMLRGIPGQFQKETVKSIYQYFYEINAEPVVFHWTYKLDEISEEEANSKCNELFIIQCTSIFYWLAWCPYSSAITRYVLIYK